MTNILLWIDNAHMDQQINIEALRAALQSMTRGQARALAVVADLSPSTVEKFRLNHIKELKFTKLRKLFVALATFDPVAGSAETTDTGVTAEPAAQG